ncbi:hypothetical protein JN11_04234 [Mucilaginibacter frigoritolerans]|jgi:hypothetical protein|uniref:Uncharacterized protein n=1 Tax=Mucilaginibacter frigoritolerans TaxID=652788 RepID=A0A562TQT6_9SPHI|nr:hypothetical protein [Mucilaginibacter frigoritolerans]TWI95959.1 hypothetical protein JN11_04234 [Mucilaginibacter frigoritolerans]
MGNKVPVKFMNNSNRYIPIAIFQIVKNTKNEDERRIVFSGAIPSFGFGRCEIDDSIRPLACLSDKRYEVGALFEESRGDRAIELVFQSPTGGEVRYDIDYWE